jgi:tRNA A-37 threonylcarbamoyl transferase component Bud32
MDEKIIAQNEKKIVYKVDDKAIKTYGEMYDVAQILNEALNQARMAEAKIKVPTVYEVKRYNDRLGIVMDYIEGKLLSELIKEDASNADKYIEVFAKTQNEIFASKSENLNNSYGRIKKKIFDTELPMNIKYGLFYKLREIEFARDVIHGDYNLSNVIISKDGTPYIFDWSHVAFGDKKFDIAISYTLFEIEGEHDLAEKYLEKICALDRIDKTQIFKMMVLACVYIVDRYNEEKKKLIYNKIYETIKSEEA